MSKVPLYSQNILLTSSSGCQGQLAREKSSGYRGTSLIRTPPPVGPDSSPMPGDLW